MVLCKRKFMRLQSAFGFISILAILSFVLISRFLDKPIEMRMSVKDSIQTWDNLAHLVQIGSFSKDSPVIQENFTNEITLPRILTDYLAVGNSSTSRIHLLNSSNSFTIGQIVSFRLDIFNGYRMPLSKGGDDVRVCLTDNSKRMSAVCSITDLNNGSYIANFKALFKGMLYIHATMVYPREFLHLVMSFKSNHVDGFFSALFKREKYKEVTLCAPFPALPNYTQVCNFSKENNNVPWYCGHPYNVNLSCSDWSGIRPLFSPLSLPFSETEKELINALFEDSKVRLIPTDLKIHVKSEENTIRATSPCNERTRPLLQSWIEKSPRGYIQDSEWRPSTCQLVTLPDIKLRECLQNTTYLMFGDSDQYGMSQAIHNATKCQYESTSTWPHVSTCSRMDWNFKVQLVPDAFPLSLNVAGKDWTSASVISSTVDLEAIPPNDKYIILLQHYLSLLPYDLNISRQRIQKTRYAINRIMMRNPNTFVVIKGPHAVSVRDTNNVLRGDHFVKYYSEILTEEYKELWKNILFIDGWDVSVAIDNKDLNLPDFVESDMTRLLLAYACDFFS